MIQLRIHREKRMTITSGGGETTAIISNNDIFDDANGRKEDS
jgi:hypothetical protein